MGQGYLCWIHMLVAEQDGVRPNDMGAKMMAQSDV